MAKSSIAEAWLRSINSSKQDKDTSRKELRDENTAFTQGTKEVSGQISKENNPTIDRQKNFLLSQSRFKAINFSNSHDDLRNKNVENFNSVLEQLQLRRARSEKDISENDSDESVSQAQVWLRPTSYIKSEKNTLEKEFGEDNSKRQARFSANFVPKVENSIPDNLIYGNIGQDRLKAASVPKSEKDSPSKDFTGVRALVREINASKSEQEKTTGDKFRGQTRFKAVISPTSEAGNPAKDIVAVRARVKEINDIKPGKKSSCIMKEAGEKDFQAHKTSTLSFAVPKLSSSKEKSRVFDDQKTFLKDDVITLYRDLEKILRSENCDKDLISILDKSNPGILKILEKRREDMETPDHSIVIAGETSSGKSTLINKIIGKKIFKGKILESTATVCKLRNSEKVKIIVEYTSGKPNEVRDMQLKYNPDTEEGRKKLREVLKQLTDISVSKEIDDIECVDVGFPIPFLKDGIVLVDTPGIGGSGEFNKKVIEYIPNAEVFIFVINVYNAGGMQGDRLPKILKEIVLKQMDNEMPCFDPKNVLFITNKWDLVKKEKEENDSDSSDDENATKIWEKLLSDIKEKWPSVKGDHIFKMSLKEISPDKLNPSVTQFGKFMETLKLDIENAEKTRAGYHFRFLQQLLRDITKGLQTKLELNKMSEETEHALLKKQEENIRTISQDCTKVREKLLRNVKEQIEATTKSCHDYLSSAIGKEQIFNFEGVDKLLAWNPRFVSKRVKTNVCKYVENLLNSEDVKKRFDQVKDETISYYEKVYLEVHVMENDWMHGIREGTKGNESEQPFSPVWLLLLAAEVGLRLVCTGVTVPLDPDNFSLNNSLGRDTKIKLFTNSSDYDNFMSKVCGAVSNHLESTACAVLTKLIDKITLELLPRRIEYSVEVLRQIKESRVNILAKRCHLLKLEGNVRALEEKVKAIEKNFN